MTQGAQDRPEQGREGGREVGGRIKLGKPSRAVDRLQSSEDSRRRDERINEE